MIINFSRTEWLFFIRSLFWTLILLAKPITTNNYTRPGSEEINRFRLLLECYNSKLFVDLGSKMVALIATLGIGHCNHFGMEWNRCWKFFRIYQNFFAVQTKVHDTNDLILRLMFNVRIDMNMLCDSKNLSSVKD